MSDFTLNSLYNAADALVFTSEREGFGYPVAEAMAAGLPVLASDIEPIREVTGGAAMLIEPTVNAFLAGIKEILNSPLEYISRGRERSTEFATGNYAQTMQAIYEKL